MAAPPERPVRNTFSRAERLRGKKAFDALFAGGRSLAVPGLRLLWMETGGGPPLQIAFAVPKKKFKKATDRNRIRRRLREAYRLHKHEITRALAGRGVHAAALLTFTASQALPFRDTEGKIILLLQRFKEALCGTSPPSSSPGS
jgi:ribonuclease P protein component